MTEYKCAQLNTMTLRLTIYAVSQKEAQICFYRLYSTCWQIAIFLVLSEHIIGRLWLLMKTSTSFLLGRPKIEGLIQGGPKTGPCFKVHNYVHGDEERCSQFHTSKCMFSSLSAVRVIFYMSLHLNTFAQVQRNHIIPKIPINLSTTFNYCTQFAQHSQITINADYEHL